MTHMLFYGVIADGKCLRDGFVAFSARKQLQYLALTIGEKLERIPGFISRLIAAQHLDHFDRHGGCDDQFASRNPPDGILSLIHISEPTRRTPISYAVFCLK